MLGIRLRFYIGKKNFGCLIHQTFMFLVVKGWFLPFAYVQRYFFDFFLLVFFDSDSNAETSIRFIHFPHVCIANIWQTSGHAWFGLISSQLSADPKEGGKLLLLIPKGIAIDHGGDEGGEEGGGAGQGDAGGATSLGGGRQVERAGEKLKKKTPERAGTPRRGWRRPIGMLGPRNKEENAQKDKLNLHFLSANWD